ncbi:unnamed protein product [Xylocopa violacea]|uniref:Uncharacterized protein n=1 Tax=Xylocopa violacea TaxID=135666 RepID=A0ABP1NVV8_XYLVO
MACKMSCHYRKARLTEDSEWLTPALEIFLEAHRLLTNFMNFFRFHAGKCYNTNYDAVPLHGALEIVPVAMTSIMCGNALRNGSPRPGLFYDMFPCFLCRRLEDLPEAVSRKVDAILTNLRKSCDIENIMCEIKDVLSTLEKLEPCATSEKLHILSLLLKEIMRKIICCDQNAAGPRGNTRTRLALNLVNNFIRDWGEKRSVGQPFLRTCKFCDHVISETTRQWGMFCCNEAENFNNIRTEWILRQSISGAHKEDPSVRELKSRPLKVDRFADATRAIRVTDYESGDAKCLCKNGEESRLIRDRSARGTSVARRSEEEASAMKAEVERQRDPRREPDKFDSVEGGDLTGRLDGKMVGEIKSRDIAGTGRHPIATDVRAGRDDVPYKSKLEEIRGPRGLRDASEKRTAVGKMRKIKRDEAKSETESDRLAGRRGGATAAVKSAEKSSTPRGAGRGVYRRRLRASERMEERVGTEDDADYGEKTSGRRRGKKPRNVEDVEVDETGNVSDGKGVRRVRKRKKPDAVDSDGKGVSYGVRDEERGVRKTRDGTRLGEGDETDSDLRRRRKGVKPGTSSAADKSTLDSENPSGPSKKGRRRPGSSRTDDDYSKTNGSRYRKGKTAVSKLYDLVSGDPNSIEYQLSDGHFVSLGWTVLPVARTMRKIVEYQTMPAKPHLDWFKKHKYNGKIYYNDGFTVLANFHDDGSAEVFYPNGVVAIKLQRPQNRKCNY